ALVHKQLGRQNAVVLDFRRQRCHAGHRSRKTGPVFATHTDSVAIWQIAPTGGRRRPVFQNAKDTLVFVEG
ncbi:hypothetical protein PIB30_082550, partial [Stylosanthes scabra]|nr:hypothetical protein [Stylosanthes scabra]